MKRRRYTDDFRANCVLMLEAAGYDLGGDCVIYGIFERGHGEPFYIGTTKYTAKDRYAAHIYEIERKTHYNKHLMNKVLKVGVSNVECLEICKVSEHVRYHVERDLIKWLVDGGVKLTNKIYNGIDFDINNAILEYKTHPGLTSDRVDHILNLNHVYYDGAAELLRVLIVDTINEMLRRFPGDVERDFPQLAACWSAPK